jgi:hypothetical protein
VGERSDGDCEHWVPRIDPRFQYPCSLNNVRTTAVVTVGPAETGLDGLALRRSRPRRALGWALGLALPWFPVAAGGADLLALLAFVTVAAVPVGAAAGALGVHFLRASVAWSANFVAAAAAAVLWGPLRQGEPSIWDAACGVAPALGLALAGLGLGCRWSERLGPLCALATALVLAAIGLPLGGGLGLGPLPSQSPERAALWLDLSPLTLAAEAAGIDWMRHPSIYDAAGTDWFSGARRPYRGLEAGVALVVGCLVGGLCAAGGQARPRSAARVAEVPLRPRDPPA